MKKRKWDMWRNNTVSFIFQDYKLIDNTTIADCSGFKNHGQKIGTLSLNNSIFSSILGATVSVVGKIKASYFLNNSFILSTINLLTR